MCTRDSAATIGINDFFLLFKKKWHMPCQCGREQGCYKIAQSVWKFLKIFPPLITVEFFYFCLTWKQWVTNLVELQQLSCRNKQQRVAMTVTPKSPCKRDGPSWSDDHRSEEVDALQHLEQCCMCLPTRSVVPRATSIDYWNQSNERI